jgi:hypothetical protein
MLAFVHIAKTGGRTVETLLASAFGLRHCQAVDWQAPDLRIGGGQEFVIPKYGPDDFRRLRGLCPGSKSVAGHQIALWSGLEQVVPDVQYFCFLREPLARSVSHFLYHRSYDRPDLDWREWLDWSVHHDHQTKMLARSGTSAEAVEMLQSKNVFVGLTERFDESLVIFRRLFAPGLRIAYQRRNTARDRSPAQEILADGGKRAQLAAINRQDQELYDHVRRELYPRFQREYGPGLAADVVAFQQDERDRVDRFNLLAYRVYRRALFSPLHRLRGYPRA